jgi:hypothetical protein
LRKDTQKVSQPQIIHSLQIEERGSIHAFEVENKFPRSSAFHSLEYVLLFQGKEQGIDGILRAGLSILVTDRVIAAIFAGETAG